MIFSLKQWIFLLIFANFNLKNPDLTKFNNHKIFFNKKKTTNCHFKRFLND